MRSVFEMGFRNAFRGQAEGPVLGQLETLISIIPQLLNTGLQSYEAKRAADRAKQARDRNQEQQKQAAASQAAADAANKKAAEARAAQEAAGTTPYGSPLGAQNNIFGMDPTILAVGGIGILGVGAALFLAFRK